MAQKGPYVIGARFLKSSPDLERAPDHDLPEIAIAGRSNVGKSSLINTLCNQKRLAKTSKTPGKTRLINFFEVRVRRPEFTFCLVDLPGYGFAKVSRAERRRWGASIEPFLKMRRNLVAVGQLIDARHPPTRLDGQMREWLSHSGHRVITVLTKTDKISRSAREASLRQVRQSLLAEDDPEPILFSTVDRIGLTELLDLIVQLAHPCREGVETAVVDTQPD